MSRNSGGNSFNIAVDTGGLDAFLDQFGDAVEDAVRPAAQAAAQVLYQDVKRRVPVSTGAHWFYGTHGKYLFSAGTLRDSIYQVFSKDGSRQGKATYHVSWNYKKCPYGFMVEYGTSRAPAHPFIRPATAKFDDAVEAAKEKLVAMLMARQVW